MRNITKNCVVLWLTVILLATGDNYLQDLEIGFLNQVWCSHQATGSPTTDDERPTKYKTYTVDPGQGEDMSKVNALKLGPGDKVVIAPGIYRETLAPSATGTSEKPVIIEFAPGRHEFRADRATKLCYFVSNSADDPLKPRPIGILIKNCRHVKICGGSGTPPNPANTTQNTFPPGIASPGNTTNIPGKLTNPTEIWFGDRMTYFINDQSEDITYSGLTFDSVRPTVSEFRVLETEADQAIIKVAEGSTYKVEKGRFAWTGDLGPGWTMVQEAIPDTGRCWRRGQWNFFGNVTADDLGGGKVRCTGKFNLAKGHQYQFRNITRDTTSAVNTRCKNIRLTHCDFHSLPGMGIVSQFTENLTFERVNVVPRPGTIRTCPAWADCFHFSGCRGDILVEACNFSGTQDDPINVHGTHLRIVEKTGPKQLLLRFMQSQTYGFPAFQAGDKVEFVNHRTLRGYASNTVTGIKRKTDKEWLLTLAEPVGAFGQNDVVDNVSWYPNVTIRKCTVTMDSCRGFLITTRGKALIEGCIFTCTHMSAILVEDDAEGWFESGPIKNLTIRENQFIKCGNPVISINPHISGSDASLPVHENIRIQNNSFDGGGISARSVKGLTITRNRFNAKTLPIQTNACTDIVVQDNELTTKK